MLVLGQGLSYLRRPLLLLLQCPFSILLLPFLSGLQHARPWVRCWHELPKRGVCPLKLKSNPYWLLSPRLPKQFPLLSPFQLHHLDLLSGWRRRRGLVPLLLLLLLPIFPLHPVSRTLAKRKLYLELWMLALVGVCNRWSPSPQIF